MEDAPFLCREEENETVDKTKKLLEEGVSCQGVLVQRRAQGLIVRVRKEALSKRDEGFLDADAQMLARADALFAAVVPPLLERTVRDGTVGRAEARLVREQPKRGEVGVPLLGEDAAKVGLDPRRPREA